MLKTAIKKVFGSKNERELKQLLPIVHEVNELEKRFEAKTDAEVQSETPRFRERLEQGEPLDDLLPEAFAVVREGAKRVLGMRHFDVQIIGGSVLHSGRIAEMKTGEGKTLVATLPVYLNALTGKGVHVVTVNDYLARRDAEWMGQVYNFLGLEVGINLNGMSHAEKCAAYRADVTYGQNNEFGFDYLRDNMKFEMEEMSQRSHYFAIVDEVDSILIDEARTPLIISGPMADATDVYQIANAIIPQLREEEHYEIEIKEKRVTLSEAGVARVEELLGIDNLYDVKYISLVHHVDQALKAHITMHRDTDYVVRGGEIIIVDEFTGRLMPGRRWSDGLHQAIEAKEGVKVTNENQTLATVTFQNYFRLYEKLAGMTGTADTEAVEFKKIYDLDVVVIPTNKPLARKDYDDVVYATESGKFNAVCREIRELHERGQPVLVGTGGIAKSELLGAMLKKQGIPHHILNAKQHQQEAEIVAQAGRLGAVTISTNMAGRGTDIVLGGNAEVLARAEVGEVTPENEDDYRVALEHYEKVCSEERQKVLEKGGLFILGTERHESRRIDNQLRGRAGRQGDPGASRFYVSLQDDLMKRFGGEKMQMLMARFGLQDDDALEGRLVGRSIENAQKKVEGFHFDARKHLLDFDNVMNKQREVIYGLRDKVLRGTDFEEEVKEMVSDVIEEIILSRADERTPVRDWDLESAFRDYSKTFGIEFNTAQYLERQEEQGDKEIAQDLFDEMKEKALERYEMRQQRFGPEQMRKLERIIYLQSIDTYWKEHLANLDHLRDSIGLRAWGQRDPLREYQRESFMLFDSMLHGVKMAVILNLFLMDLPSQEELERREEEERERRRLRDEGSTSIHEEFGSQEEQPQETKETGLNREQRRREEQQGASTAAAGDRGKKKKKRKAEKKARKRNR